MQATGKITKTVQKFVYKAGNLQRIKKKLQNPNKIYLKQGEVMAGKLVYKEN